MTETQTQKSGKIGRFEYENITELPLGTDDSKRTAISFPITYLEDIQNSLAKFNYPGKILLSQNPKNNTYHIDDCSVGVGPGIADNVVLDIINPSMIKRHEVLKKLEEAFK